MAQRDCPKYETLRQYTIPAISMDINGYQCISTELYHRHAFWCMLQSTIHCTCVTVKCKRKIESA